MTPNTETMGPTLVLGGTGKTGRRVAARLTARGVPVRIGSRSADPPFDWEDPSTWAPALDDVRAVYIAYYPDVAVPGAPDVVRSFAELALPAGDTPEPFVATTSVPRGTSPTTPGPPRPPVSGTLRARDEPAAGDPDRIAYLAAVRV